MACKSESAVASSGARDVMEWAALHEEELGGTWQRVTERKALASIEPLA